MTHEFTQLLAQPRSQGLSPLPPLSLGKETLVAAGHVTTQNLGGKKICWTGGVAETLWISKSRAAVKNYPLYQGLMWKFADEEMLHYFCCVQNIEDFRLKEIRPGSLFPTTREAEERDPGNEIASRLFRFPRLDVAAVCRRCFLRIEKSDENFFTLSIRN